MAEKDINLKQVLKRFPPGDRWQPVDKEQPVFSSLTEGIEWVFQNTEERDYVIKAAEGKVLYIMRMKYQNLNPNHQNGIIYTENTNNL